MMTVEFAMNRDRHACDHQAALAMALAVAALLLCSLSCLGQNISTGWPPAKFPIGMWCSPPEPYITVEQYKHIAAAGFTVVSPPSEGTITPALNHKILETARAAGLKAIVGDPRLPLSMAAGKSAENAVKAVVTDYRKHPALLGYFLTDEPAADAFGGLAEVAAAINKLDPDHLVYINLFPNYATTDQLKSASYEQYLDQYLRTVSPAVLSYDHYPFLTAGDRPEYYANLDSVQRAASATKPKTPFWQIVLSVQHGGYRKMTEDELRLQAMQSLVYGAQGLVYFTYWLPGDSSFQWSNAIMNRDGTDGPLYEPVKRVNAEVRKVATWLYGAQVTDTYQTGQVAAGARALTNEVPVSVTGGGDLSIGLFRDNKGYVYVMIANRNYRAATAPTVTLDAGKSLVEILDQRTNKWQTSATKPDDDGHSTFKFEMGPAGYVLLRWQ
jgi:hypothetical protein